MVNLSIASHPERFATSRTMKLGLGDHDLISAIRKQNTTRPQPKLIEHRSMKGFDNDRFLADIGKIPRHTAYIFDDIDDICEHWYQLRRCHTKRSVSGETSYPE